MDNKNMNAELQLKRGRVIFSILSQFISLLLLLIECKKLWKK